jgi:hypothetical protein
MNTTTDWQQTKLAKNFTVLDYMAACKAEDMAAIAEALHRRFTERYINPVTPGICKHPHGFTIMAISCLMIESLQSFREGWKDTNGKSEAAFCRFFDYNPRFDCFRGHFASFYRNVRCGILHQAETTGGWKINRMKSTPLFDPNTLTINAILFLNGLKEVLDDFCTNLKNSSWDSDDWKKVRIKMNALCEKCKT